MLSLPPGDNDDKRQGSCRQEPRVPLPTLLVYCTEKVTEKVGMGFGPHRAPVSPPSCVCAPVSASVLLGRVNLAQPRRGQPSACTGRPRPPGRSRSLLQCLPPPCTTSLSLF